MNSTAAALFYTAITFLERISKTTHLGVWDGGHELHDAVGDSFFELETAFFPKKRCQETHQYAVLLGVLKAELVPVPTTASKRKEDTRHKKGTLGKVCI